MTRNVHVGKLLYNLMHTFNTKTNEVSITALIFRTKGAEYVDGFSIHMDLMHMDNIKHQFYDTARDVLKKDSYGSARYQMKSIYTICGML